MKYPQKKYALFFFFCFLSLCALSQEQEETQFDSTVLQVQPLIKIKQDGGIIKDVNMIANGRFALNNDFENGDFTGSQLKMNDLRMELRGKITDRLEFRFRDVITRSAADAATTDLVRRSIDLAYVAYEINPKLTLVAGKMFAEYGGYEIFYNPITMLVYNDWISNGDIFLSAIKVSYQVTPKQTLNFQIANSSSRSFADNYGTTPDVAASKIPFGYTINWNGNLGKAFSTKWSYTNFTLAEGMYNNVVILGARYRKNNLTLEYDFKYSQEDLDRTGIVSRLLGNEFSNRAKDTRYVEHWLRVDYFITPVISTTIMGMVSSSYWPGNPDTSDNKTDILKTLWTVTPRVEYHLNKQHNTKLFVGYVGKFTKYSDYARSEFGFQNIDTSQILVGFTSHFIVL